MVNYSGREHNYQSGATVLRGSDLSVSSTLFLKKMPFVTGRVIVLFPEDIERILALFPQRKLRMKLKAGMLSTGEQQMLALGRALMLKPTLLLADEPSLGLSPNFVDMIFDKLSEINRNGTSILLVEQNAQRALEICHRGYVFDVGSIALEGPKESLLENEKVKKVFLGE